MSGNTPSHRGFWSVVAIFQCLLILFVMALVAGRGLEGYPDAQLLFIICGYGLMVAVWMSALRK
jgi:hypothetical protein